MPRTSRQSVLLVLLLTATATFSLFASPLTAKQPHTMTKADKIVYPKTEKVDQVDTYHGTKVADPYRWLEEDVRESERVAKWVEAQNKVTFDYLKKIPAREKIQKRLTELWDFEKILCSFQSGRTVLLPEKPMDCKISMSFT